MPPNLSKTFFHPLQYKKYVMKTSEHPLSSFSFYIFKVEERGVGCMSFGTSLMLYKLKT